MRDLRVPHHLGTANYFATDTYLCDWRRSTVQNFNTQTPHPGDCVHQNVGVEGAHKCALVFPDFLTLSVKVSLFSRLFSIIAEVGEIEEVGQEEHQAQVALAVVVDHVLAHEGHAGPVVQEHI